MAAEESEYRCWVCLEDSDTLDGMIAPCKCVGTNKWVHDDCLKTYCLQALAANPVSALKVGCPICKSEYTIVPREGRRRMQTWRELFAVTSTDRQLVLRHCRFFLLAAPLVLSTLICWAWLVAFWRELYLHGLGEPLMVDGAPAAAPPRELPSWAHGMLPESVSTFVKDTLDSLSEGVAAATTSGRPPVPEQVHPAHISKQWSQLYVWLQYVQWYKVLSWLLIMFLGGSDGFVPSTAREVFRIEELLLASEARAQTFIFGQCLPFVLTKARHFLVTWLGGYAPTRVLFYSLFTSHVESGVTLACDSFVAARLLHDWWTNLKSDFTLRLDLNRLRSGYFGFVSGPLPSGEMPAGAAAPAAAAAAAAPRQRVVAAEGYHDD